MDYRKSDALFKFTISFCFMFLIKQFIDYCKSGVFIKFTNKLLFYVSNKSVYI